MIAVSSFRPLDECGEYRVNQIAAKESWEKVFDKIIFVNHRDERMDGEKIEFVTWTGHPRIGDLIFFGVLASIGKDDWCCLINADIIVSERLLDVERQLQERKCLGAISSRYNFDPKRGPKTGNVTDLGLDFFAAKTVIWEKALGEIPEEFRIGHCLFDTWLLGFLNATCRTRMADITPARCIFHPIHGNRHTAFTVNSKMQSPYWKHLGMPRLKIAVANKG